MPEKNEALSKTFSKFRLLCDNKKSCHNIEKYWIVKEPLKKMFLTKNYFCNYRVREDKSICRLFKSCK